MQQNLSRNQAGLQARPTLTDYESWGALAGPRDDEVVYLPLEITTQACVLFLGFFVFTQSR